MADVWDDDPVVNVNTFLYKNDPEAWARVGRAVVERRTQYGVSQAEAGKLAGVGETLWNRLEGGRQDRFQRRSITRVERYLRWQSGAIERLLLDEETPEPVDSTDDVTPDAEFLRLKEGQRRLEQRMDTLEDLLRELLDTFAHLPRPPKD